YIAEAGEEEAIKALATSPRSYFNPTLYLGSFPIDVTKCFFSDSTAPNCPVTLGTGSSLINAPVQVGSGSYTVRINYLGRFIDGGSMTVHRYRIVSTATLSSVNVKSQQTASGMVDLRDFSHAFPPHAMTSCVDPASLSNNVPTSYIASGVVDPAGPAVWPGTSDANNGVVPNCSFSDGADLQKVMQLNADFSYSTSVDDSVALPPQFWKIAPTGTPPDPSTGVPYIVYINGNFTVNGNTTVYGIYYITGSVTFSGAAQIQGVVYAPNGTIFTGRGGGSPNVPDVNGGFFANGLASTGSHYNGLWNAAYTNSYLGEIPLRVARSGR
ncbi:MAG: hypothetical protein PHX83_05295, partial [Acidobacteriia bacterium]|nr:hypothetical protein [Terriglobia bacterium]